MLLAPTAWRRRFFVRHPSSGGPHTSSRHRRSPGEELGCARVGSNPRGLRLNSLPRLSVPSQLLLHCARRFRPMGKIMGALRSRRIAAGAVAARAGQPRARRDFLGMTFFSKALRGCFSHPTGRKVPAGACAGGSRVTPGVGQAMRAARARWGERERARRAAAASQVGR